MDYVYPYKSCYTSHLFIHLFIAAYSCAWLVRVLCFVARLWHLCTHIRHLWLLECCSHENGMLPWDSRNDRRILPHIVRLIHWSYCCIDIISMENYPGDFGKRTLAPTSPPTASLEMVETALRQSMNKKQKLHNRCYQWANFHTPKSCAESKPSFSFALPTRLCRSTQA